MNTRKSSDISTKARTLAGISSSTPESKTPIEMILDRVTWKAVAETAQTATEANDAMPHVTHTGVLTIGPLSLDVVQLSDGQRVILEESMLAILPLSRIFNVLEPGRGGGEMKPDSPMPRLFDKKEVAEMLKCSVSKVEKMMKAGTITFGKIGTLVRFRPSDVEPFFSVSTPSPGAVAARKVMDALREETITYGSVRRRR